MEPRPKYAAPRRTRTNAPALECQAHRTGRGLGVVDSHAKFIRTRMVIVEQGQQAKAYQQGLDMDSECVERLFYPAQSKGVREVERLIFEEDSQVPMGLRRKRQRDLRHPEVFPLAVGSQPHFAEPADALLTSSVIKRPSQPISNRFKFAWATQ